MLVKFTYALNKITSSPHPRPHPRIKMRRCGVKLDRSLTTTEAHLLTLRGSTIPTRTHYLSYNGLYDDSGQPYTCTSVTPQIEVNAH